jgi:hypothetical protein
VATVEAPEPAVTICDEGDAGFGWISSRPPFMERASHALLDDGGVWLVDPVDFPGLDERIAALGEPHGVLQLLDRHTRDCAAVAARLGVPHLVTPSQVPGSPFTPFAVPAVPGWKETALWWEARRTLVVTEAVGTARYYRAPGRPLGVNPVLRLFRPPTVLLGYEPEHLLVGHGAGLHENAAAALEEAVQRSRRDLLRVVPSILGAKRATSSRPS